MFMIDFKQLDWWYWFITACLLSVGVAGYQIGFILTIGLALIQLFHFAILENNATAFPVQIRFCFAMLVLIALPEQMQVLYWLPAVGTWARSIFGYCLMARLLSLLPWNRREPFSLELIKNAFLTRPVRGNILHGLTPLPSVVAHT